MAGFKDFADGNYFTAAEVDGYLMSQAAMRFTDTADLVASLSGHQEYGMLAYADDLEVWYMWNGTNWAPWASTEKTASVLFTAGGTNITVGNSVVVSKWRYSGGMVQWNWSFTVGTTANMQSGNLALALPPVAIHADHTYGIVGQASFQDISTGIMYHRACVNINNTTNIAFVDTNGTRWSTTSPIGFAAGDVLNVNVRYRPAVSVLL